MQDNFFASWSFTDKRLNRWFLAILSGILWSIAWPVKGFPFISFLAFVPILILDEKLGKDKGRHFFILTYTSFLIWNVLTTWWVYNSTPVALLAFTANSALQYLPVFAYRITKHRTNRSFAYTALPVYWIAFEYLHLTWQLSWPWLTVGNVFSEYPEIVQWYEFTGVLGGTLWVLLINILIYISLRTYLINRKFFPRLSFIYLLIIIIAPIIESVSVFNSIDANGDKMEIVVVQPNIDPYTEKFQNSESFIPFEEQLDRLIELSESKITSKTELVMWPETAIDSQFDEDGLESYKVIQKIRDFRNRHPQIALITGLTTFKFYPRGQKSFTRRFSEDYQLYYDIFNTALFINENDELQTYHKSKLVPGVEIMPYPSVFGILQKLSINLGGTSGGFGRQEERTVFRTKEDKGIAPAICYESIYGDFLSEYVRNDADVIAIITNDGWWGDSPGYKQHNSYARLRAVEFRRPIARSANTGISGFIDIRGNEIIQTEYWEKDVRIHQVQFSEDLTFFAEWGAFLGRTAWFISVFMLLSALVKGKTDITLKKKKIGSK